MIKSEKNTPWHKGMSNTFRCLFIFYSNLIDIAHIIIYSFPVLLYTVLSIVNRFDLILSIDLPHLLVAYSFTFTLLLIESVFHVNSCKTFLIFRPHKLSKLKSNITIVPILNAYSHRRRFIISKPLFIKHNIA